MPPVQTVYELQIIQRQYFSFLTGQQQHAQSSHSQSCTVVLEAKKSIFETPRNSKLNQSKKLTSCIIFGFELKILLQGENLCEILQHRESHSHFCNFCLPDLTYFA